MFWYGWLVRLDGAEDPPEDEAARRRHGDMGRFATKETMGRGAAGRQRLQHSAPGIDALAIVGIAPVAKLIKEPATGGKIAEAGRAARATGQPRWPASDAHAAPRSHNSHARHRGAIGSSPMVRTAVVAARRHGVMGAQGCVAPRFAKNGPVFGGVGFQVAEGCGGSAKGPGDLSQAERPTVTAMLARGTAQRPKGMSRKPSANATKRAPPGTTWTCPKPLESVWR